MVLTGDTLIADMLHPATIATLERTPGVMRTLLEGLPDEVVKTPGAQEWSPLDVMAHLLSVHHAANLQRVRWMLDADDPPIPNIDEQQVLESSGMRAWPLDRLLDDFATARAQIMQTIRALTPEQLTRSGRHEVAGTITIADVLHHVAYHDLLHVAQVARLLLAPLDARRGAMQSGFPDQG